MTGLHGWLDQPATDRHAFLSLLQAEPTLMPIILGPPCMAAANRRAAEEVHMCLHCGALAECVLIACTSRGARWLDLCQGCYRWLKTGTAA